MYIGPGSSVGITTELRAGRSGDRTPVGARFSSLVQTGPGSHPAPCTMGTRSLPGIKSGRSVTLTPHPLLVPWSWKGRPITSTPPKGRTAWTEPQYLYKGALYLLSKSTCFEPHGFIIRRTVCTCSFVWHVFSCIYVSSPAGGRYWHVQDCLHCICLRYAANPLGRQAGFTLHWLHFKKLFFLMSVFYS
jgi:hypothetical protein